MKNSGDNVSGPSHESELIERFLNENDFSQNTRRAFDQDLGKFSSWFVKTNREQFRIGRITTRDVSDFRDYLRREKAQATATVNRALVTVRRFLSWLVDEGHLTANPATKVKELKRQQLAPKGLERPQARRLLREVELRDDVRANAIFHLLLFTGCRVGDLVNLELSDLMIGERSGTVVFRLGKGGNRWQTANQWKSSTC